MKFSDKYPNAREDANPEWMIHKKIRGLPCAVCKAETSWRDESMELGTPVCSEECRQKYLASLPEDVTGMKRTTEPSTPPVPPPAMAVPLDSGTCPRCQARLRVWRTHPMGYAKLPGHKAGDDFCRGSYWLSLEAEAKLEKDSPPRGPDYKARPAESTEDEEG